MSQRRSGYSRRSGAITKALGLSALTTPVQRLSMEQLENERQFMGWVIDLADLRGWRIFHDEDSRRNRAGLPDLILVRGDRLLFAELKTETGRVRPEQHEWLASLLTVSEASHGAVNVYIWRPSDRTTIERILA